VDNREPDFLVRYRFLRLEEGGRSAPPRQGYRPGWLYDGDDPVRDGAWMIWPRFVAASGAEVGDGPVPSEGMAQMFVLDPKFRPMHLSRLRVGTKGFLIEGKAIAAECEVVEVKGRLSPGV